MLTEAQVVSMRARLSPSLVPIVVAVTGHRDLRAEDLPVLTIAVTDQLRQISGKYPNTPCLLLTGLAEGADRLAAHCALQAGWQLGVVLPLSQQLYEQDFSDQGSIDDFRNLISQASWCRVISSPEIGRPECYERLGLWLYQHSHTLLAVWDGEPGKGPGGTAEVVRLFREGRISGQDHLAAPDACTVIHVQASRASHQSSSQTVACGAIEYLLPRPAGMALSVELADWHAPLKRIEDFNRDAVCAHQAGLLSGIEDSLSAWSSQSSEGNSLKGTSRISPRSLFLVSDRIALHAQRERSGMFKGFLLLAACALVLTQAYSGLFTLPVLLWVAIVLTTAGIVWYRVCEKRRVEQRYLDYRALAEACKVQYFWQVAGVGDSVCSHYLRERSGELDWIRLALRSTTMWPDTDESTARSLRLKWVRDHWLEDQRGYFLGTSHSRSGKAAQNRRLDEIWSGRSRVLAFAGAVLMVFTAIFHLFVADLTVSAHEWSLKVLMVSYSLVFGAAGLCKVYQQTSAFSEHARKYERTGKMLQIAISQLDAALEAGDEAKALAVIRSCGIDALDENGDWLLLHRERPASAQGFG